MGGGYRIALVSRRGKAMILLYGKGRGGSIGLYESSKDVIAWQGKAIGRYIYNHLSSIIYHHYMDLF
jgi:hypothetical protein